MRASRQRALCDREGGEALAGARVRSERRGHRRQALLARRRGHLLRLRLRLRARVRGLGSGEGSV